MPISTELSKKIKSEITSKIGNAYSTFFEEGNLDVFLDEIIESIEDDVINPGEINEDSFTKLIYRIRRTKKRWVEKEIKEELGFYREVNVVASLLHDNSVKKFKLAYGVENLTELKELRLKELNQWANDDNSLLVNFLYIKDKMKYQVNLAIANDCKYIALSIAKNSKETSLLSITRFPEVISAVPYDSTNRAKLKLEKITNSDKYPSHYVNKYLIDNDRAFESIIEAEALKSTFVRGVIGALNYNDFSIFMYLLSIADKNFLTTREVIAPISDIVVKVFREDKGSGTSYTAIKDSLFKMQHLSTGVIDSKKRGFTLKILDNVSIVSVNNRDVVRVLVNEDIVKQIVEENTINMYPEVMDDLQSKSSRILVVALQKERHSLSLQGELLVQEYGLSFFRTALYIVEKKKYRVINSIEKDLEEIREKNTILKSFSRKNDVFTLEYYPVTEKEKIELSLNKAMFKE